MARGLAASSFIARCIVRSRAFSGSIDTASAFSSLMRDGFPDFHPLMRIRLNIAQRVAVDQTDGVADFSSRA
jgi:hypothetical protein